MTSWVWEAEALKSRSPAKRKIGCAGNLENKDKNESIKSQIKIMATSPELILSLNQEDFFS